VQYKFLSFLGIVLYHVCLIYVGFDGYGVTNFLIELNTSNLSVLIV
jgi:hypothetical protein